MLRARLERADEPQVISGGRVGAEKIVRRRGRVDLREPVLSALLGRLERDGLPFGLLLRRALRVELHHGAGGEERENFRGADLDRFLDNEVHVFSLRDGLGKGDVGAERRGDRLLQNAQANRARIERADLGGGFASAAIEENDPIARRKTKNAAGVVRLGAGQLGGRPVVRREVEAMHEEKGEG